MSTSFIPTLSFFINHCLIFAKSYHREAIPYHCDSYLCSFLFKLKMLSRASTLRQVLNILTEYEEKKLLLNMYSLNPQCNMCFDPIGMGMHHSGD